MAGVGSLNYNNLLWFSINGYILHHNYDPLGIHLLDNIAMLRLTEPITTPGVSPIPFVTLDTTPGFGVLGSISGFGIYDQTTDNPSMSNVLRMGDQTVVSQGICQQIYGYLTNGSILASNFCAFNPSVGSNFCGGDQGTGFIVKDTLLGIASTVKDASDCGANIPSLYVRISSYWQWINTVINNNQFTQS